MVSPSKSGDKFYRGSSMSSHWVKDLLWQKHTQKEKRVYQIAEEDNVPLHAQSVSNTVKIFKEKKKVQQEQDRKEARAERARSKVPSLNTRAGSGAGLDGRPLTAETFNARIRSLLRGFRRRDGSALSLPRFSSHSLRSGGATALFAGGASTLLIQQLGRWASEAYLRYCRLSAEVTKGVSALMLAASSGRHATPLAEEP